MVMELAPVAASIAPPHVSVEEYLVRERRAEYRSDYVYGEIRAMSGGSLTHNAIIPSLTLAVGRQLQGKPCMPLSSDMKIAVEPAGLYVYPDLAIVCGKARLLDQHQDILLNPTVIFEVISPSTEDYDRGLKGTRYRQVESLQDYIMISQSEAFVEHFSRREDGLWVVETVKGLSGRVRIESIDCTLLLSDIYERVEFGE